MSGAWSSGAYGTSAPTTMRRETDLLIVHPSSLARESRRRSWRTGAVAVLALTGLIYVALDVRQQRRRAGLLSFSRVELHEPTAQPTLQPTFANATANYAKHIEVVALLQQVATLGQSLGLGSTSINCSVDFAYCGQASCTRHSARPSVADPSAYVATPAPGPHPPIGGGGTLAPTSSNGVEVRKDFDLVVVGGRIPLAMNGAPLSKL